MQYLLLFAVLAAGAKAALDTAASTAMQIVKRVTNLLIVLLVVVVLVIMSLYWQQRTNVVKLTVSVWRLELFPSACVSFRLGANFIQM